MLSLFIYSETAGSVCHVMEQFDSGLLNWNVCGFFSRGAQKFVIRCCCCPFCSYGRCLLSCIYAWWCTIQVLCTTIVISSPKPKNGVHWEECCLLTDKEHCKQQDNSLWNSASNSLTLLLISFRAQVPMQGSFLWHTNPVQSRRLSR